MSKIYHRPKTTYMEADLIDCLSDMADDFLELNP